KRILPMPLNGNVQVLSRKHSGGASSNRDFTADSVGKLSLSILVSNQTPYTPFLHSDALGPPSAGRLNEVHPKYSAIVVTAMKAITTPICHALCFTPFIDILFVLPFLIVHLYRKDRDLHDIPASLWKKI